MCVCLCAFGTFSCHLQNVFELHEKKTGVHAVITVGLADPVGWLNIQACGKSFNVVIFSDPINVIQVRHSMMVLLLIELY